MSCSSICSILPAAATFELESEETFILCFAPENTAAAYLLYTLCKWSVSVSAEHAPPCVQQMQYLVQQGRANRDSDSYSISLQKEMLPKISTFNISSYLQSTYSFSTQHKEAGTSCKYQGSGWEQLGAAARSLLLCSKLYTTAALQHCSLHCSLLPPAAAQNQ